jgi:ferritin-like metal-binding protein YciE
MTGMTEPRELLIHELGDLYYAEQLLTKALPTLADEAEDDELKQGFKDHLAETKQHVKNLEKAFEALGENAQGEKCPGIEGIKAEHDKFMADESPSADISNTFLTGAGARAEHYEIAAYNGAITLANGLDEDDVADLLKKNLADEKKALSKLETIAKRLASATTPA